MSKSSESPLPPSLLIPEGEPADVATTQQTIADLDEIEQQLEKLVEDLGMRLPYFNVVKPK